MTTIPTGWEAARTEVRRRLLMGLAGFKGWGKTLFAVGATPPIWYYKLETGDEGILEPIAATGKQIFTHRVYYSSQNYEKALIDFLAHVESTCVYVRGLPDDQKGTFVFDTMTEAYELSRFFHFGGRQNQVDRAYGPVYVDMKEIVRNVEGSGASGIFINKMGRSRDDKVTMPDGSIVGAPYVTGWSGLEYEMQVMLKLQRLPEENLPTDPNEAVRYLGYIEECRQKAALRGQWLEGKAGQEGPGVNPLTFDYLLRWVHG